MGATAPVDAAVCAAVCGFTSAPVEKLFPSQESQAVLWWVFGGAEFGREKHLQPSSSHLLASLPSLLQCLQCCETTCAGICGSVMCRAADVVSK